MPGALATPLLGGQEGLPGGAAARPSPGDLDRRGNCHKDRARSRLHARRLGLLGIIESHTRFKVSDKFAGQEGPCPKCKAKIKIPAKKVVKKCGEPDHVETREVYPDTWISKQYDYQDDRFKAPYLLRGPILQELWTYRFGPNRLPYYLHFQNGRLTHLETGRRHD